MADWTFFTNYGHVLFVLALNPSLTVREIALMVGITERATLKIISDLVKDEFIEVTKVGRQNTYKVMKGKHLRHDIEKECSIGDFIDLIKSSKQKLSSVKEA